MNITKCDGGCGKMSPDEKGCYPANGWFIIEIIDRRGRFDDKKRKIFCKECFNAIKWPEDSKLTIECPSGPEEKIKVCVSSKTKPGRWRRFRDWFYDWLAPSGRVPNHPDYSKAVLNAPVS